MSTPPTFLIEYGTLYLTIQQIGMNGDNVWPDVFHITLDELTSTVRKSHFSRFSSTIKQALRVL